MKEIVTREAFARQEDLRGIVSVFSGELFSGVARETFICEGKNFLTRAFDADVSKLKGDIVFLSAGILERAVKRILDQ